MSSLDKAVATQLANIQAKTGKTLEELAAIVRQSGLTKHTEIRAMFQRDLGLGHGDANSLVHAVLASDGTRAAQAKGASQDDIVDQLYTGGKEALRPIHDALMAALAEFGPFEILPKKGYVSLRRRKQFAMIGPPTKTRVDVGLNAKELAGGERLIAMPAGGMCQYNVRVTDASQVDQELIGWIREAYEQAG
jgi:hypothetical protein